MFMEIVLQLKDGVTDVDEDGLIMETLFVEPCDGLKGSCVKGLCYIYMLCILYHGFFSWLCPRGLGTLV
jgi:hypothetical protein